MKGQQLNKVTIFTVFLLIMGIAFTIQVMGLNDTTQPTIPAGDYTGGLLDFYACTRGNVQSACNALYDTAQDSNYTGGLLDFYACTRGNVQSACDALYDNVQAEDYTGGLLDFYACTRGNVQSACDALYDTPFNS